jgi:two-component system OmpR family response regulator
MHKLLLIEDDKRLALLIQEFLSGYEFDVHVTGRGDTAVASFHRIDPDVVVLDLMLPGMDGVEVCRLLRQFTDRPILMLTARADTIDQVAGLEIGADDYVLKPVEPRLLLARLRAIMRRGAERPAPKEEPRLARLVFGQLSIDELARDVRWKEQPVDLKTSEYNLLLAFAHAPGQVLSRDDLMKRLRGIEFDGLDRSIDAGVSRLRRRFDDMAQEPQKFKTVWGRGYLFNPYAWED